MQNLTEREVEVCSLTAIIEDMRHDESIVCLCGEIEEEGRVDIARVLKEFEEELISFKVK